VRTRYIKTIGGYKDIKKMSFTQITLQMIIQRVNFRKTLEDALMFTNPYFVVCLDRVYLYLLCLDSLCRINDK
jgi:hypothetical protein